MSRGCSLPALRTPGGPAQQREYDRIMQANALLLTRLRGTQGEINTKRLEDSYEKATEYVRIACEYPPPLLRRKVHPRTSPSRAGLTRLPGGSQRGSTAGRASQAEEASDLGDVPAELRYVLREDRPIC